MAKPGGLGDIDLASLRVCCHSLTSVITHDTHVYVCFHESTFFCIITLRHITAESFLVSAILPLFVL